MLTKKQKELLKMLVEITDEEPTSNTISVELDEDEYRTARALQKRGLILFNGYDAVLLPEGRNMLVPRT